MRPRLDVIAQRAGVSLATVSRVLNNQPNVAGGTRERVLIALRELAPPRRQTLSIGLIVPDTGNPFFTDIAFELDRECERRGARLMMASSDGRADRELELLERFAELGVDGLLFVTSGTAKSQALLRIVTDSSSPAIVSFDRGLSGLDRVAVDSRKGAERAVDHLVRHGHERIAYLSGLVMTETASERLESFRLAMATHYLTVREEWIFDGDFRPSGGAACAAAMIAMSSANRPTALMAANDVMAIILIQRLQEAGWMLPRDLSVIGFDDVPAASWIHPRLTTIAQPSTALVREAMNLLSQRIAENSHKNIYADARMITLESELVIRESTSAPGHDESP